MAVFCLFVFAFWDWTRGTGLTWGGGANASHAPKTPPFRHLFLAGLNVKSPIALQKIISKRVFFFFFKRTVTRVPVAYFPQN